MASAAFGFPALRAGDPGELGGFRPAARLGEGGMGQVFLAFSPGGQPAAVKVIRGEFAGDAEFGRRFAREVAVAQKVRGAHLAPLLDADPHGERPWLATGYVAGPSLRDLVVDHGPLPARQVLLLAWGIAHALADIHAAGVVHRDLKPGNVMLDESGPKVIDFGIVKSLTRSATYRSDSTRIGTPLYMSPEQALGRPVGPSSDLFALGSTLHYLATGREAFGAENEWAVVHRVVADDPDLAGLDGPLRDLVAACLAKEPERRPTPEEVRARCEAELGDALGPGAWMGITGARAAIRERTDALRRLAVPGAEDTVPGAEDPTRPVVPAAPTTPEPPVRAPAVPTARRPDPAPPGVDVRLRVLGILLALLPLAVGFFAPFTSETWTTGPGGVQVARVVEAFDAQHPWQPIATGVRGITTDAGSFIAVLVIGTAAAVAFALLALLTWSADRVARGWGYAAHVVCGLWFFFCFCACAILVQATVFGPRTDEDNPAYTLYVHVLPGAWGLLAANALIAFALYKDLKPDPGRDLKR